MIKAQFFDISNKIGELNSPKYSSKMPFGKLIFYEISKNYSQNILKIRLFHCFLCKKSWNLSTISPNKNQTGAKLKGIELTLNRFPMLFLFQCTCLECFFPWKTWHRLIRNCFLIMPINNLKVLLHVVLRYSQISVAFFEEEALFT